MRTPFFVAYSWRLGRNILFSSGLHSVKVWAAAMWEAASATATVESVLENILLVFDPVEKRIKFRS